MRDRIATVAEIRAAEERAMRDVSEETLMARAADAVADSVVHELTRTRGGVQGASVVALAGTGNNGGDALLALARLAYRSASVTAVLLGDTAHGLGVGEVEGAHGTVVRAADDLDAAHAALADADAVIDGIVGLGARPGLREPAATLVASIPERACVIAVDIPSGLAADSGEIDGPHVTADVTVTFTALKRCLEDMPASTAAGSVVIADVGVEL